MLCLLRQNKLKNSTGPAQPADYYAHRECRNHLRPKDDIINSRVMKTEEIDKNVCQSLLIQVSLPSLSPVPTLQLISGGWLLFEDSYSEVGLPRQNSILFSPCCQSNLLGTNLYLVSLLDKRSYTTDSLPHAHKGCVIQRIFS